MLDVDVRSADLIALPMIASTSLRPARHAQQRRLVLLLLLDLLDAADC